MSSVNAAALWQEASRDLRTLHARLRMHGVSLAVQLDVWLLIAQQQASFGVHQVPRHAFGFLLPFE
jgi:hypothetical protein